MLGGKLKNHGRPVTDRLLVSNITKRQSLSRNLRSTAMLLTILSLGAFAFVDDGDLVDGAINVDTPGEGLIEGFQSAMDRCCGVFACHWRYDYT